VRKISPNPNPPTPLLPIRLLKLTQLLLGIRPVLLRAEKFLRLVPALQPCRFVRLRFLQCHSLLLFPLCYQLLCCYSCRVEMLLSILTLSPFQTGRANWLCSRMARDMHVMTRLAEVLGFSAYLGHLRRTFDHSICILSLALELCFFAFHSLPTLLFDVLQRFASHVHALSLNLALLLPNIIPMGCVSSWHLNLILKHLFLVHCYLLALLVCLTCCVPLRCRVHSLDLL
jgi:hypothetical protein